MSYFKDIENFCLSSEKSSKNDFKKVSRVCMFIKNRYNYEHGYRNMILRGGSMNSFACQVEQTGPGHYLSMKTQSTGHS